MNRRRVIGVVFGCLGAGPLAIRAASDRKMHRIGVLCTENVSYFWKQLQAIGYEEHRNVEYVFKDVDAASDLSGFAARLATANVDLIVACGPEETIAAKAATSTIPIVMLYGIVPVELGLVASLARPGGNVTGSSAISVDMASKSVELFKSVVPELRRLSVVVDLDDPVGRILHAETVRAAKELGIEVGTSQVRDAPGLDRAFSDITQSRAGGIMLSTSAHRFFREINGFAIRQRLPAMYPFAPAVRAGGLMAYSPNWLPQSQKNAHIVDRILKGAPPAEIPVEQPLEYAFGINLKTARAIGLTIPPAAMLRATWVVE
jgi:putative ABC transport system substrate-binding protein